MFTVRRFFHCFRRGDGEEGSGLRCRWYPGFQQWNAKTSRHSTRCTYIKMFELYPKRWICFFALLYLFFTNGHLQIDCLPEVVQAVNGKCEVYLDEGIRSGSDVLKALALGAKAVFLAKLPIWALACGVRIFSTVF